MCKDFIDRYMSCPHTEINTELCNGTPFCYPTPVIRRSVAGFCTDCAQTPSSLSNSHDPRSILEEARRECEMNQRIQRDQQRQTTRDIARREQRLEREERRLQGISRDDLTQDEVRRLLKAYIRLVNLHSVQNQVSESGISRLRGLEYAIAVIPDNLLEDIPGIEKAASIAALRDTTIAVLLRNETEDNLAFASALKARYNQFVLTIPEWDREREVRREARREAARTRTERLALVESREAAMSTLLKSVKIDQKDCTCGICGADYGQTKSPGNKTAIEFPVELPCPGRHVFGKICLLRWIRESPSCPMCRYDLNNVIDAAVAKNTSETGPNAGHLTSNS